MTRFHDIPCEVDTKIKFQSEVKIGDIDAVHQMWSWDEITAESLIFVKGEIASINIDELQSQIKISYPQALNSSMTTQESGDYFFINFNFQSF